MLVAVGVLGLAGCGEEASTDSSPRSPDQDAQSGPTAAESRPGPAKEPQQERPAREPTRAELAREVAKEVCSISTIPELAKEFGVPSELAAVVAAYAEGSTPDAQIASEQGCLEGLTE